MFAAGVDQLEAVGSGGADAGLGALDFAAQLGAEVDGFPCGDIVTTSVVLAVAIAGVYSPPWWSSGGGSPS